MPIFLTEVIDGVMVKFYVSSWLGCDISCLVKHYLDVNGVTFFYTQLTLNKAH